MRFNFALFSSLLLGSVVLAGHHREHRQSQFLKHAEKRTSVASDSDWAGAVWKQGNGTFNSVTGTLTIPNVNVSGQAMSSTAAAWVGIDGDTCSNVILLTGVAISLSSNGSIYKAWYEWYPRYVNYFTDIDIFPGDVIRLTVSASNATSGLAKVENLSKNQSAIHQFQSSPALCGQNAEWVVQGFTQINGSPLANFGVVTFTDAGAGGQGNDTFGPLGATTLNINQNGQNLTSVSVDNSSITIKYV